MNEDKTKTEYIESKYGPDLLSLGRLGFGWIQGSPNKQNERQQKHNIRIITNFWGTLIDFLFQVQCAELGSCSVFHLVCET